VPDAATSSSAAGQTYGEWAAPKQDGALLIWPDGGDLTGVVDSNRAALTSSDRIRWSGVPLPEIRRSAATYLGLDPGRPVVATGHQSELHHPGVWVKNAVVDAVASAAGAQAVHLALDTDSPKHLDLRWPGFRKPLTDDPRLHGRAWSGLVELPSPRHLDTLIDAADAGHAVGAVGELMPESLRRMRAFILDQRDAIAPLSLPAVLADAQHAIDWDLGLRYSTFTMSGLVFSPSWLLFVTHLARHAVEFAASYNAALAAERKAKAILDPERPMPDLSIDAETVELPFWLDDENTGRRRRLRVRPGDVPQLETDRGALPLESEGWEGVRVLERWLRVNRLRISSRALSLTHFVRVALADLFVHGIGGGHYDQVCDRVLRDFERIDPPTFCVATGTLFHPAAVGRDRVCWPCIEREGHRLRHAVLPDKRNWLDRIASAEGFHAKRDVFDAMHAERRRQLPDDEHYAKWRSRRAEARRRIEEDRVLFDRELWYAVQPPARLRSMIDAVRAEIRC
jgi:hypothetical protein